MCRTDRPTRCDIALLRRRRRVRSSASLLDAAAPPRTPRVRPSQRPRARGSSRLLTTMAAATAERCLEEQLRDPPAIEAVRRMLPRSHGARSAACAPHRPASLSALDARPRLVLLMCARCCVLGAFVQAAEACSEAAGDEDVYSRSVPAAERVCGARGDLRMARACVVPRPRRILPHVESPRAAALSGP